MCWLEATTFSLAAADSRDAATVPLWPSLLCIIPPPPGNKFQSELLFFRPSFILLNQTLCLSLLLYLPPVSMVTSLSALYTIYLFLRFPLCLSHSVLIFLILLSSLPPFLLLYPTPSSLRLLSLFTFICLSPFSPLQACHSIMLVFWFLLIERKFYRFPCQFCIFNHFQFIQPTFNAIESCIKLSWADCVSVCDCEMETIGAGGCSLSLS